MAKETRFGNHRPQPQNESDLQKIAEQYSSALDNVTDLIHSVTPGGAFVYVNRAWRETMGFDEQEMSTLTLFDVVPSDSRGQWAELLRRAAFGDNVDRIETKLKTKDGRIVLVEGSCNCTFDQGQPVSIIGIFRDITERERAAAALRASESRFRALATHSPVGIFQTDVRGNSLFVNERWGEIAGLSPDRVIGKTWAIALHPGDSDRVVGEWQRALAEDREFDCEYRVLRPLGAVKWVSARAVALKDENGNVTGHLGTVTDITDMKSAEDEIRELSLTDEMTGLRNRRGFIVLCEQQLKLARKRSATDPGGVDLMLVYADLDGLKQINDRYGHQAGDLAINKVAEILRETFRDSDILARMGGDEFTVLVVDAASENEELIQKRLRENLTSFNSASNSPSELALSVGITRITSDNVDSIEKLLTKADAAMYQQKRMRKQEKAAVRV
jgi:diguanylate cyclase (GGDEF)-like protein/PAS domain S-box-containing protein